MIQGLALQPIASALPNWLMALSMCSMPMRYTRPDFNAMIQTTVKLLDRYRIFVGGANPSFIRTLKEKVDEDSNYELQISFYKKNYHSVFNLQFLQQNMFVIPFAKHHKDMLTHYTTLLVGVSNQLVQETSLVTKPDKNLW